jgi:CRISPR/Cas system-associated endonuclease/helicase Cas3
METVTIKNIKIFDKNNPNFTIINTDEEIQEIYGEFAGKN